MSGDKIKYSFNALRRDVMMALCLTKLSGTDFRIIILILNQTDAYHRDEDKIRPAFFVEKTGLAKGNVRRAMARLRNWKIISKQGHIYTVLSPDKWDKAVFTEQQKLAVPSTLGSKLAVPSTLSGNKSASNLKRSALKIEAVSAQN